MPMNNLAAQGGDWALSRYSSRKKRMVSIETNKSEAVLWLDGKRSATANDGELLLLWVDATNKSWIER